jgi:O-antigen/teichoic acid export membrane protein
VTLFIIFFAFFQPSIVYVGVVTLTISFVHFILHFTLTKKLLPVMKLSYKFFDLVAIRVILSSGVWSSVNQLGALLLSSLSLLIFNVCFGPDAAGDYSIVLTIPNIINGVIVMMAAVFMPVFVLKYAKGNTNLVIKEVHNSQRIMGLITNTLVVVFMVVGENFFLLWVPGENAHKLHVLSLLAFGHLIITGVTWPIANLNTVMNKVKIPSLYMVGSGLVDLCLMLFLINFTSLGIYSVPLSGLIVNIVWVGVFVPIYPCKELDHVLMKPIAAQP